MSINRLLYLLIVIALLITACAPQPPTQATPTQPLSILSSPSPMPTLTATEAPVESSTPPPNPFAGSKAWIAYQTDRGGEGIWLIHPDGPEDHQIAKDFHGHLQLPDWSPDGKWIVFATHPLFSFNFNPVVSNLYRMRSDGSAIEQLTSYKTPEVRANQPQYTPDGNWILFTSVTSSSRSLGAIPAEGGDPIMIAQGGIYTHATWQP